MSGGPTIREGCTVGEDRILDKLDELGRQSTQVLVEIGKLQEQTRDLPAIRDRVAALEKWRWTAMGALGAAGTSLLSQIYTSIKGA